MTLAQAVQVPGDLISKIFSSSLVVSEEGGFFRGSFGNGIKQRVYTVYNYHLEPMFPSLFRGYGATYIDNRAFGTFDFFSFGGPKV